MRQYLRTFSARNASPDVQSYKVQVHVCQILIPLYTHLQKVVCFTPKNHPNTNSWERIKLQNPRLKSSSFPSGQTTSSWEEPEEEKEDEVESRTFHGFPQVPLCHIVTSPRPLRLSHTYTHLWMSGDSLTVVSYWSTRGRGGVWLEGWNGILRNDGNVNRERWTVSPSAHHRASFLDLICSFFLSESKPRRTVSVNWTLVTSPSLCYQTWHKMKDCSRQERRDTGTVYVN